MARLNGQDIVDKFNNLVDDQLDAGDDFALQLANDAKDEIEGELKLKICQALDESKSTTIGQTYITAKTLPTDFLNFSKPYIFVGTIKYYQVNLDDKQKFKDSPYKFYYDPSDGIHLCGTQNSVQVISIPYIKSTDDIELDTYPIWPKEFHALIPMRMAIDFYPIDQGEKSESWQPEWLGLYQRKLDRFIDWDTQLKLSANGGRSNYRDDDNSGIPLGNM